MVAKPLDHVETVPADGLPRQRLRPLRLALEHDETSVQMQLEPRRALALLRAANLLGDTKSALGLLRLAGRDGETLEPALVTTRDCVRLAARLRRLGYPLDDDGIRRFRGQRGLSPAVRIGPDLAAAYARWAAAKDVRVDLAGRSWHALGTPTQRALRLLLRLEKSDLTAIARALAGPAPRAQADGILLPATLADSLVRWAASRQVEFTDAGLTRLARLLRCSAARLEERLAGFLCNVLLGRAEPVHDYTHMRGKGRVLNGRTVAMLDAAQTLLGAQFRLQIVRGSYERQAKRGAHPHLGGGAVDLVVQGGAEQFEVAVLALRRAGFAAWYRKRNSRPHIHAIAIGDRELCPAALWQVRSYFLGKDGRTRMGADPHGGLPDGLADWLILQQLAATAPP
jgi:hypothetical protein